MLLLPLNIPNVVLCLHGLVVSELCLLSIFPCSYEEHHDYIDIDLERQQGVRILTVYLYLNDVEAGGGTNFPKLNVTVMPKRGRALIWPSVRDDDPSEPDTRTDHQALPVMKGIKYGANLWYHQRDVSVNQLSIPREKSSMDSQQCSSVCAVRDSKSKRLYLTNIT
jgi:2OG-Fe(II) oxygenase superfamily